MQAKKRAKSVKFGKKTEVKKSEEATPVVKTPIKPESEPPIEMTKDVEEPVQAKEEPISTQQEIKQEIATKISSKTTDKQTPPEINLTSEPPTAQQETPETTVSSNSFGSFTKDFDEPEQKKSNFLFFLIVVLITFVLGIVIIGGFYYFSNKTTTSTPTPTPIAATPTTSPSPTEEPSVDLSSFKIEVLNGSGISGIAAKVKTQLTDAGFTVDSIGNAENSDFTKTVISTKENINKVFLNSLILELEKTYEVDKTTGILGSSSDVDVEVTIGSSVK